MIKGNLLYEGKAKSVFETDNPNELLIYFKDDATAGNGAKHEIIEGKGVINNKISQYFFKQLKDRGIKSHFVEKIGEREMIVKRLDMIKLEVVVRNIVAGSLVKRLVRDCLAIPATFCPFVIFSKKVCLSNAHSIIAWFSLRVC